MFGTLATFLSSNEKMPFRAVVKEISEPYHYSVSGQARCKLDLMLSDGITTATAEVHQPKLLHGFFKINQTFGFRSCVADGDKVIVAKHSAVFIIAPMSMPENEVPVPTIAESIQRVRKRSLKSVSDAVTSPKKTKFGVRAKVLKVEPTIHRNIDGQMTPITNILVADSTDAVLQVGCFRNIAEIASKLSPDTNVFLSDLFRSNYQRYPSASTTEKTELQILPKNQFEFDMDETLENSVFKNLGSTSGPQVMALITGLGNSTVYPACPQKKCSGKKMQPTKDGAVQCPECSFALEDETQADLGLIFDAFMDVNGHFEESTFYSESTKILCGFDEDERLGQHSKAEISEMLSAKLPISALVTKNGSKWKILNIV